MFFDWNLYPNTDFNSLNLDWILEKTKKNEDDIEQLKSTVIDYDDVINKPKIENVELNGNKTLFDLNGVSIDNIAEKFSESNSYQTNEYCFYNGNLYRFTNDKTPGVWDASFVELVSLCEDVTSIHNQFDGVNINSAEYSGNIITFNYENEFVNGIHIDTDNNTATLTKCGRNIYPKYTSGNSNSLTWVVAGDGSITFSGTPSADVLLRLQNLYLPFKDEEISVSMFNNKTNSRLTFFGVTTSNVNNWQLNMTVENANTTTIHTDNLVELRIRIPKDIDWTGLILKPMLVYGDVVGDFEEYKGVTQTVTLINGIVQESVTPFIGSNTMFTNDGAITVSLNGINYNISEYVNKISDSNTESFYRFNRFGDAKYLYIYYKSGKYWVRWELHNVPAVNSNSNTWQLGKISALANIFGADILDIVRGGEFELAFKEHGAADYCGGNNHGDENTDIFILHIDGKMINDLNTLDFDVHRFNCIDAIEIATVNRCNTPGQDILKHQKIWTFEKGKVYVKQTIKYLEALDVDGALVCMFPALRSSFFYGVRQYGVAVENMTTNSYATTGTTGDNAFYEMYGQNVTAKIKSKTDNPSNSSRLWINPATDLNKLYFGYYGATDSSNPVSVPIDSIITVETEYEVMFSSNL